MTWLNYVVFYQRFSGFVWQVQGGFGIQFKNEDRNQTTYLISAQSLLGYPIVENKLFLLATIEYSSSHEESIVGGWRRLDKAWAVGGGLFWQIASDHWSMNASFKVPFSYELASLITTIDAGSWKTLNVGIRYTF